MAPAITFSKALFQGASAKHFLALLLFSFAALFGKSAHAQTYCTPSYTSGCSSDDYIESFSTTGGSTNITNNNTGCSGTNGTYYSTMTHTGVQNTTVNFSVTETPGTSSSGYPGQVRIWVDWDQNGTFSTSEEMYSSPIISAGATATGSFTIPISASTGTTRMRVRQIYNGGSTLITFDACANQGYGEYEDYNFTVVAATPCTGTPAGGTATASNTAPCPGATVSLSVTGGSLNSGITYQWLQEIAGVWTPIAGATGFNYTTPNLAGGTYKYRRRSVCTSSAGFDTSASVTLTVSATPLPYTEDFESITANNQLPSCMASTNLGPYYSGTSFNTYISTTSGPSGGANHTPGGSKFAGVYAYQTAALFTPGITLQTGKMYQVKFWYKNGSTPSNIDSIVVAYGSAQTIAGMNTTVATIPPSAATGTAYTESITNFVATANATVYFGFKFKTNSNNYNLNSFDDISIIELPPCSGTPVAGTITPDPANPCIGKTAKLSLAGGSQVSGLSYQWQQYNFVTATWGNIGGATNNNYITPTLTDSVRYRTIVTCTNPGGSADTTPVYTLNPYTVTLPYLETFESITANDELPTCWAATNFGNQTRTFVGVAPYPSFGAENHTPGGSNYATFFYYYPNNWFFSPALKMDTGKTYMLKFWHVTGSGFNYSLLRAAFGTAQDAGAMVNPILAKTNPNNTTYQLVKGKFNAPAPGLYNIGINVETSSYPYGHFSIDDINLIELPPCAGKPAIVMDQADTIAICPDSTASTLLTGSAGDFSGFAYQWDSSINGTTWFPIPGEITEEHLAYSSGTYPAVYYRLRVTCAASGLSDTGYTAIKITQPIYAPLPYFNGFETWENSCATTDVPSGGNWKQYWYTGNASWRRNDQGASANWTSVYGDYYPDAQSGSYSARFNSYGALGYMPPYGYGEAQLDMYLNCSANAGVKGLYFYYINQTDYYGSPNDSLTLWYSIDGGLQYQQVAGWDGTNADDWSRRVVNIPSNSQATIVSFRARNALAYDYTDIGIDSVYVADPCTGTPTAGTVTLAGSSAVCAGASPMLSLAGTSMAGGILVQWEASTTNSTTGFVAVSAAGTQYNFNTPPVSTNTWFRARVTCGASGLFTYSNVVAITTTTVNYATLPFVENFESWSSRCATSDIPSANWTNNPADGDASWRRHDQGNTANWSSASSGGFFPGAAVGNYSARFHNYYEQNSSKLDLYVNCSGTGNKELRYYLNMSNRYSFYTNEYTRVSYSMDGGVTFSVVGNFTSTQGWEQKVHVIPSTSATTIVRFECSGNTFNQDMGLDYVEVLPACTGTPVAGVIDSVRPCSGASFQLKVTGTSPAGGLTYQWQSTTAATATGFTNPAVGGTAALYNTAITQPTWYRLIVTCPGSNQSDTTAPFRAQLNTFYNCYCAALPYYPYQYNSTLEESIGKVTLSTQPANTVLLSNGVSTPLTSNTTSTNPNNPGYSSFTNLPATPIYHDSTYKLSVQQVSAATYNSNSVVAAWIDYNQDGAFDQVTERVTLGTTSSPSYLSDANFTVPATAKVGVTAMRVILAYSFGGTTAPNVCGIYNYYGETEDYLVEVRYHPCAGVVNAGIAMASDLNTCPGYKVTLTDTSYEKQRYGLVRSWQQSTNGGSSWSNIPGSQNRDTFKALVQGPTKFRFALACSVSGVNSYSNVLDVKMNEAYQCYCASYADGGASEKADSSDVGSFSIGNYTFQVGGPHLQNPAAIRERTDYTEDGANVIELFADSTYKIDIYHIMRGRLHRDAKVTLFMDFNNDFQYTPSPVGSNYPSERVLTAFTSAGDYYLDNLEVTIPKGYVIANKLTGMRLILNEAVGASNASDQGCGVYGSGETEDFAVIFRDGTAPQGVGVLSGNVKVLSLYPNPTSGVATLSYSSDVSVRDLELTVTGATGQVILRKTFSDIGRSFSTDLELGEQARGVYFVELKADGERIIRKLVTQ